MNRIEFYNKLSKFREYHELTHSAQDNKYYTKIDKYYSDGRARYFWSKEEWDAYQKEKNAKQAQGAQNAGADRAQKEKDNAQYESNMTKRKAGYKENKAYDQNAQKDKGNAETYNAKTKEINNTYNDIAKNTQFKLSPTDEAKLKIHAEAEKKGEEINKQANEYNKQRNIEQNKKFAENAQKKKGDSETATVKKEMTKKKNAEAATNAGADRGQKEKERAEYLSEMSKRKAAFKERRKHEKISEASNKGYEENAEAEKAAKMKENAKSDAIKSKWDQAVKEKKEADRIEENKKKWAEAVADKKEKDRIEENKKKWEEAANKKKEQDRIAENKKKWEEAVAKKKEEDAERERIQQEELEEWKEKTKDKVNDYALEIYDNIRKCSNDRSVQFNVDNEFVDLFKEALAKRDSDFDGDIAAYVRPYPGHGVLGLIGNDLALDEKHTAIAKEVLQKLEEDIVKSVNSTTVNDEKYDDFLGSLKEKQTANREKAIDKEMKSARSSLEAMYNGSSERLELDKTLKKELENKLQEIDPEYEKGNLYKYVRPYIFGKWIKDDDSYNKVLDALDELEKELKAANKHDDVYGEFIDKVSKIL